jgi:glycogen operon protein
MNESNERGEPIVGDTLLLLINAHWEEIQFTLPQARPEHVWQNLLDTHEPDAPLSVRKGGTKYPLFGRTLAVLRTTLLEESNVEVTAAQVDALRKEARRANQPSPNSPPLM